MEIHGNIHCAMTFQGIETFKTGRILSWGRQQANTGAIIQIQSRKGQCSSLKKKHFKKLFSTIFLVFLFYATLAFSIDQEDG